MVWTTERLSKEAGVTSRHIRRLISDGVIQAEKAGRDWIILDDEARRFLDERRAKAEEAEEDSSA